MPKLVLNHGTAQAWEYELKPGINSVGRNPANDFRIEEGSVSVFHAQIILDGRSVTVKDLGSTNGTFISRSQVREGFLNPGQILQLGRVELMFVSEAPAPAGKSAGFAPTIALPQVSGMNVVRPVPMPANAPKPAPVPMPASAASAASVASPPPAQPVVHNPPPVAQSAQAMATVPAPAEPAASYPADRRTSESAADAGLLFRCLALGFGGMLLAGVLWITFAALSGTSPAPYASVLAGLFCGLALMVARDGRRGVTFSLMATGFCLLAVFAGEAGQVFSLHAATFSIYTLAGLLVGLILAWRLGGGALAGAARSAR
jgi:hypothetical protein